MKHAVNGLEKRKVYKNTTKKGGEGEDTETVFTSTEIP